MGKHEEPKGARPNYSCELKLRGQDDEVSGEEEEEPLLCVQKQELGMKTSLLLALVSSAKAGSNLDSFIQQSSRRCTRSAGHWVSPRRMSCVPGPRGVQPAKRGDNRCHGSLCWAVGWCGDGDVPVHQAQAAVGPAFLPRTTPLGSGLCPRLLLFDSTLLRGAFPPAAHLLFHR